MLRFPGLSQGSLGAIHRATFIPEINMAHAHSGVLRSNPSRNIHSENQHGPCSGQNLCGALSGATFIPGIPYPDLRPLSEVLRSNPSRNIHSENQHGPCSGQNLCGALSCATFIPGMSYPDVLPLSEVLRSNPSRNIHSENQHDPCSLINP